MDFGFDKSHGCSATLESEPDTMSIFAAILTESVNRSYITVRDIADIADTSESTVYRWLRGESEPSASNIRDLIRHEHTPHSLRDSLKLELFGVVEVDMDFNHDGRVDMDDLYDVDAAIAKLHGDDVACTRDETRDGQFTEHETAACMSRTATLATLCKVKGALPAAITPARRKAR